MNGTPLTAQLRKAASLRKVRAFLKQIEELKASDFPHRDSESALAAIEMRFQEKEQEIRSLPLSSNPEFIDETFNGLTRMINRNTDILGFILRSTNIRNAFELYFPLKRLVQQVLGKGVSLLISSEWQFVPFTYPMNLPELPSFVLVGGPAPESGNALIIPLAGHEIGHSVWRKRGIDKQMKRKIDQEFRKFQRKNQIHVNRLSQRIDSTTEGEGNFEDFVLDCIAAKAEEVFCDLCGFYIFGKSYIYAFEYLLAPGFGLRYYSYPPEFQRLEILRRATSRYGVRIEGDFLDGWLRPEAPETLGEEAIDVADKILMECVPRLIDEVRKVLVKYDVAQIRDETVSSVREAFSRRAPYGEGATLPEIVSAGWEYVLEKGGLANPEEFGEYDMLQELMLKSVEVSEVITRRSDHRKRAM